MDLKKNTVYSWSVVKPDGNIVYSVSLDEDKKWSISLDEKDVKSFGIGAWTRFEGQKAYIDFTIN